jgi:hypothetical protein
MGCLVACPEPPTHKGTAVPYLIYAADDLSMRYQENNPGSSSMPYLSILQAAINEQERNQGASLVSTTQDAEGHLHTLIFKYEV